MLRMMTKTALVLSLALLVAGITSAQQPRPGAGFGMMSGAMLLQNPDVAKELNLSEDQVSKAKEAGQKIREKYKDEFAKIRDLPKEEQREKFQAVGKTINDETDKALADVLKPEQTKRLKQLELQVRGADAYSDPEVQKNLKLTDDQKEKIKTIREDSGKEMREIFQGAQGNFQEAMQKIQTLRKETGDKITALLTADQKKAWSDMTGAAFEFKLRRPGANN